MADISSYEGRTVMITGASGFVGSRIVERLAQIRCRIRRQSRNLLVPLRGATADVEDFVLPLGEHAHWEQALSGVDVLLHCAGQTSIYAAAEDPVADMRANVESTLRILDALHRRETRAHFVMASTMAIAGPDPGVTCIDETTPPAPSTFYDLSKLAAERYIQLFSDQGILTGTILRFGNLYGPGATPSAADRGVLNRMIRRALAGEDLTIYGEGRWLRDYVYIDDAVDAFLLAGIHRDSTRGRFFIVSTRTGVTLRDAFELVADRVAARTGRRVAVRSVPAPAGLAPIEFRNYYGDYSAFAAASGWCPTTALRAGIDLTIDSFTGRVP